MIFDSRATERLYANYQLNKLPSDFDELIHVSLPLVEAIAVSISSQHFGDLVQEASIKLCKIYQEELYNPNKGSSLYSFLNKSLRNCMIDFLRKERNYEELPEDLSIHNLSTENVDVELLVDHAIARFPSLAISVVEDGAYYVCDGLQQSVSKKSKGMIQTLSVLYSMNRTKAYIFYNALFITARCCMYNLGSNDFANGLLIVSDKTEFTLIPEVALVTNMEMALLLSKMMRGCYVKF